MRKMSKKIRVILIIFSFFTIEIYCQNKSIIVNTNIDIPDRESLRYKMKLKDTISNKIKICFNSGVYDTTYIYFNKFFVNKYMIDTRDKNCQNRILDFEINENVKYVILKTKDKHLKIRRKKGYRILIISFYNNEWYVSFSNYMYLLD